MKRSARSKQTAARKATSSKRSSTNSASRAKKSATSKSAFKRPVKKDAAKKSAAKKPAPKRVVPKRPTKGDTVDGYLAALPAHQRAALESLRSVIRAVVPNADEVISYKVPAFRQGGRMVVAYGATRTHCGFYPMSRSTISQFAPELAGYEVSTGAIRFQPDHPLPEAVVQRMVRARLDENAGK